MAFSRKNRAFELRLALLNAGTPGSAYLGGRPSSLGQSSNGGRISKLSNVSRESFASRSPSTVSTSNRDTRRRPHRLPELGETAVFGGEDERVTVKINNLKLGRDSCYLSDFKGGAGTGSPLPPISSRSGVKDDGSCPDVARGRHQAADRPLPLDVLLDRQRRLRDELHTSKCLTDPGREAIVLLELGDLCIQRANCEGGAPGGGRVHAAALYNTALLKCAPDDDDQKIRIRSRLIEAERQLLLSCSKCTSVVVEKYLAMDTGARDNRRLGQVRKDSREALARADTILDGLRDGGEVDPVENRAAFVEVMGALGRLVEKTVLDLLQHMVTTCKAILGEPPCKYAILSVGPLAAGHGNPFRTPIEYIILTGENIRPSHLAYFYNFCHYMHLKILNLGETPTSRSGVRTFQDSQNEDLIAFPDVDTPCGIHLDVSPYTSSISPLLALDTGKLVTSSDPAQPSIFIGTPCRIASLIRQDGLSNLGYSMVWKLLQFTTVDGDRGLIDEYRKEMNRILDESNTSNEKYHMTFSCDWLRELLGEAEPVAVCNNGMSSLAHGKLAREVSLMPLVLGTLKINHRINSMNSMDIVESLLKRKAIKEDGAQNLRYALSLSYYLTLKESLRPDKLLINDGLLSDAIMDVCFVDSLVLDNSAGTQSWLVGQYYQILVPCWTCLFQRAQAYETFVLHDCYLVNYNFKVKALALYRLGDRQTALQHLQQEIHEVEKLDEPKKAIFLHDLYTLQGLQTVLLGELREGRSCLSKAMDLKEEIDDPHTKSLSFVSTWHNFGLLQLLSGKYDKALEQLTECVALSGQLLKEHGKQRDVLEAGIYENLAHTQTALGLFAGALKSFEISIRLRKVVMNRGDRDSLVDSCSASGAPGGREAIREVCFLMGRLYLSMANNTSALACLVQALDAHYRLVSNSLLYRPCLWEVMILTEIAKAHTAIGNISRAATYRLQAARMCKKLKRLLALEDNIDSLEIGFQTMGHLNTLHELGKCLFSVGDKQVALNIFNALCTKLQESDLTKRTFNQVVALPQMLMSKGFTLTALNRKEEANSCFIQAASHMEKGYNEKSRPVHLMATCYKHLGETLLQLGRHEEAEAKLDLALELFRFSYGDTELHPDIADIMCMRAISKRETGEFEDSVAMLQGGVELEKQTVGAYHVRTARSLTELGMTYFNEGLYESAMSYFEQAMDVYRKLDLSGEACIEEVPRLYITRARCHIALGRVPQAERCWEHALSKARSILEREPDRVSAFVELLHLCADFYQQIDRPERSARMRMECLELLRGSGLLEEDKLMCTTHFLLGRTHACCGDLDAAIQSTETAVQLRRVNLEGNDDKLELASWLTELGGLFSQVGNQERAAECHLESLYLKREVLGHDIVDEGFITSLETIAAVHERRGEFQQALALRKQSLVRNVQRHHQGDVSVGLICTVEKVASAFQQVGEFASALQYWQDSLNLRERLDTSSSRTTPRTPVNLSKSPCLASDEERQMFSLAHVYHSCGRCLEHIGSYRRAIEHYERSITLLNEAPADPDRDLMAAVTTGDVGKALHSLGQSHEAVEHLLTASSALRSHTQDRDTKLQLASVLYHLGESYDTCGQGEAARECHIEALSMYEELIKSPSREKAQCLSALGKVASSMGLHSDAVQKLTAALEEYRLIGGGEGSNDPSAEVAGTLERLGDEFAKLEQWGAALKHLSNGLQMLRRLHGHKRPHLQVARCLSHLAAVCRQNGRLEDTIAYAKQAVSVYTAVLAENSDHPELVTLNSLLGDCYWDMARFDECLLHYKKATQICLYLHNGDALHAEVVFEMEKLQAVQRHLELIQ